jgi:hypothetical protein
MPMAEEEEEEEEAARKRECAEPLPLPVPPLDASWVAELEDAKDCSWRWLADRQQ